MLNLLGFMNQILFLSRYRRSRLFSDLFDWLFEKNPVLAWVLLIGIIVIGIVIRINRHGDHDFRE